MMKLMKKKAYDEILIRITEINKNISELQTNYNNDIRDILLDAISKSEKITQLNLKLNRTT